MTEKIHCSVLCPYFVPTGISKLGRNRLGDLANTGAPTRSQLIAQANSDKAVGSGKLNAADIGKMVFDAIDKDGFFIYSHPHALAGLKTRMEDALQQRNPTAPFVGKP